LLGSRQSIPKQQDMVAQVVVAAPAQHLHSKHSWKGASLLLHKSSSPFLPITLYSAASIGRNSPAVELNDVFTGEASTANILVTLKD